MTASIPAAILAAVIPGVLGAGGNPLALNSVYLTTDPSIPVGTAQPFEGDASLVDWFGSDAPETILGTVYFNGYTNCKQLPKTLYLFQYNTAAVGAYLRGGSVAALNLTQLQALSGTLSLSINGQTVTSAAINLAGATSFTNAATLIQAGIETPGGVFTGTASQAAGVVSISATSSGSLAIGDVLTGTGVDGPATITSFGTYTVLAGMGTVDVSTSATVASGTALVSSAATATYDALREAFLISAPGTGTTSTISAAATGALATGLLLTSAGGAVTSQGAAASTPASIMAAVVAATQNWATFMTVTEQTLSNKEAFAIWTNSQNNRYAYICQDSDMSPLTSADATGSFGNIVAVAGYSGVMPVYDSSGTGVIAALQTAIAASIDFGDENGRTTFAYRAQSGLAPQITSVTAYTNLLANGYNCYAAFATANQAFTFNQPGQVSGPFLWMDNFLDQIWLNNAFQLALMELLANTPAVPYVTRGYNLIRSALLDPINAALNFGAIVAGVALTNAQSAQLNSATGDTSATATIQNTGWYLQILDPGGVVRGNRGTPTINFYYTDGGSVQQITMSSVDVL